MLKAITAWRADVVLYYDVTRLFISAIFVTYRNFLFCRKAFPFVCFSFSAMSSVNVILFMEWEVRTPFVSCSLTAEKNTFIQIISLQKPFCSICKWLAFLFDQTLQIFVILAVLRRSLTSCESHLRGLTPKQHSSKEESQRWQFVRDIRPIWPAWESNQWPTVPNAMSSTLRQPACGLYCIKLLWLW